MAPRDLPSRTLYQGRDRAAARSFLHAIGLTNADIDKPFVGVSNVWTETMPCNFGLRDLAGPLPSQEAEPLLGLRPHDGAVELLDLVDRLPVEHVAHPMGVEAVPVGIVFHCHGVIAEVMTGRTVHRVIDRRLRGAV